MEKAGDKKEKGTRKKEGKKNRALGERERELCIALEMENTREEKWAKGAEAVSV